MASSERNVSDSTTESETAVSEPAENTNTVTIDNVFDASAYGDLEKLRKLAEQDGASLSLPDNDGNYALQLAAFNNFPQIVQYIIEHGGDVNAVDNSQQTALHWAAVEGLISVADVLLQNGALLEAADVKGFRAVHFAAQYGQTSFLNHIVVKYNADFEVPDNDGMTPLHWAALKNFPEIVHYILEHGGDVNAVDNSQKTALDWAAERGSISVADVLLQNGAHVEAADVDGHRAVHVAAQNGQTSFLNHIVAKHKADFDVPDNAGMTPLHWAAFQNFCEIVQYIVEHGGDVNVVDNSQKTALHWAAMRGSISVADVLLQNGAQVEAADVDGNRAVHIAAQNGQTSFLNHIIDKYYADFDVPNNYATSPLHWAASKGFVDTVRWLLSRGASQKRQDNKGRTPLHWAARKGKKEVCTVLIDAGTKEEIWLTDNDGNTPIQLVSAKSHFLGPLLLSKALQAECKHLEGMGGAIGKNCPMIIVMQGDAYTGKSVLAKQLALRLKCPIISLDDFLEASEAIDELDTLISHSFNIIAQIVKTQILLGFSVVVDSPLSRLSHLQKLVALNTRLLIMECKPENEYAYQLRFEEGGSDIYTRHWYKPAAEWPLPKLPRDYTDDDIPHGVSKLVVDTTDYYSPCQLLRAMFDVASCGYGHVTKYGDYWHTIHESKGEQFTCPCCNTTTKSLSSPDDDMHKLTFCQGMDHCDKLCCICDNQVLGSCYTCLDCPLTLHKSCAELAHGEKKHFVPESFPSFMRSKPTEPYLMYAFPVERPCDECIKDGYSFTSRCKDCLFRSHLKSRLLPTVVQHKAHDHFLTLLLNYDAGGRTHSYMCLACRKSGAFAAYVLDSHIMYHPKCVLLPPSIQHTHGGHTHDLEMVIHRVEEMEDYLCNCCLNKMDPTAWYYYCSECVVSVHLECAFKDFDSGGSITEA